MTKDILEAMNELVDIPPGHTVKPVLGLMPRRLWLERRLRDVCEACLRSLEADKLPPLAWWDEAQMVASDIEMEAMHGLQDSDDKGSRREQLRDADRRRVIDLLTSPTNQGYLDPQVREAMKMACTMLEQDGE